MRFCDFSNAANVDVLGGGGGLCGFWFGCDKVLWGISSISVVMYGSFLRRGMFLC